MQRVKDVIIFVPFEFLLRKESICRLLDFISSDEASKLGDFSSITEIDEKGNIICELSSHMALISTYNLCRTKLGSGYFLIHIDELSDKLGKLLQQNQK